MHAPLVPAVVSGPTIPVTYDLTGVRNVSKPTLLVSEPGRVNPASGFIYRPIYSVLLSGLTGTAQVPVSALQGGGIYGINIRFGSVKGFPLNSDFAYTRVAPAGSARPAAPLRAAPRPATSSRSPTAARSSSPGTSPERRVPMARRSRSAPPGRACSTT
jgi:hypothetical protein